MRRGKALRLAPTPTARINAHSRHSCETASRGRRKRFFLATAARRPPGVPPRTPHSVHARAQNMLFPLRRSLCGDLGVGQRV